MDALIAGIDLGKRESVVTFVAAADRRRLGRLRVPTSAQGMEQVCRQGADLRERHGLGRLVAAMEPTSHFWKIAGRALERSGVDCVFVQSFVVARSRELDDLTRDKTDARDAALIADLAAGLRFTDTRLPAGAWAELDLLADARNARVRERSAALQEQRALLELVWPELLAACPDRSGCHLQALLRLGLTPQQVAATPRARLRDLVHRSLGPGRRFSPWMAERLRTSAAGVEPVPETGAAAVRGRLAAERIALADRSIADLDRRLAGLLDTVGFGHLRGAIPGLGDVTLANLLGLLGNPTRFDDARCLPKLAGSNPTERSSGEREAPGPISRRGRPALRVVVYQAAVNLVRHNSDFRDRFEALTHRPGRPLAKPAAYVAVGNKLLRTLWVLAVTGVPYRSDIARGEVRPQPLAA